MNNIQQIVDDCIKKLEFAVNTYYHVFYVFNKVHCIHSNDPKLHSFTVDSVSGSTKFVTVIASDKNELIKDKNHFEKKRIEWIAKIKKIF